MEIDTLVMLALQYLRLCFDRAYCALNSTGFMHKRPHLNMPSTHTTYHMRPFWWLTQVLETCYGYYGPDRAFDERRV